MFNPVLLLHFVLIDFASVPWGERNKENITPKMLFSNHPIWSIKRFVLIIAVHTCLVVLVSLKRDGSFVLHLQLAGYKLLCGHRGSAQGGHLQLQIVSELLSPCQSWSQNSLSCGKQINPFATHLYPTCFFENEAYSENVPVECTHKCHRPLRVLPPSGYSLRSSGIQNTALWLNWSRTEKPQNHREAYN